MTGAGNDLEVATSIAKTMVTRYGMSDKLGPRTFGKREDLVFLGREISEQRDYTEKLMIKWAIKNDIPILGVCRGAQLINLFYGGSLSYNLEKNHIAKNLWLEVYH